MSMVANGRLTAGQLYPIQSGLYLSAPTGRAFKRLQAAAAKQGRTIAAARVAGAYRSLAVQKAIRDAFDSGDIKKKIEWNLDLSSTIRPAEPGASNHGLGISVDIVGTDIDPEFKALCKRFGFTFPYGDRDPRHAVHDGRTATLPIITGSKKPKPVYVRVVRNDNLSGIAGRFRTNVRRLLVLNPQIEDANRIFVGQKVRVT